MRRLLLFVFSHRTLALLRWDLHFLRIRWSNWLWGENRRMRARSSAHRGPLYLNLGSGPRGIDRLEWVNVDGFRDKNVHYCLDFNRPLPFADASFDGIFCEHVFEHFDYEHGGRLLIECRRVMKPSAVIRLIQPDGEIILNSYVTNPRRLLEQREGGATGYRMEIVNMYFRQRYEHQQIYDFEFLAHLLKETGFVEPKKLSFREGTAPLLLDDPKYAWESLYVEASKPR